MSKQTPKTTINTKLNDLKTKIDWFYGEDFSLDQATDNYQATVTLAEDIKHDLKILQNQINIIAKDFSE